MKIALLASFLAAALSMDAAANDGRYGARLLATTSHAAHGVKVDAEHALRRAIRAIDG